MSSITASNYNSINYYVESILKNLENYQLVKSDDTYKFLFYFIDTLNLFSGIPSCDKNYSYTYDCFNNIQYFINYCINKNKKEVNNGQLYIFFSLIVKNGDSLTHISNDKNDDDINLISLIENKLEINMNDWNSNEISNIKIDISYTNTDLYEYDNYTSSEYFEKTLDSSFGLNNLDSEPDSEFKVNGFFNKEEIQEVTNFKECIPEFIPIKKDIHDMYSILYHMYPEDNNKIKQRSLLHNLSGNNINKNKSKIHAILSFDDCCINKRLIYFKNYFKNKNNYYFSIISKDKYDIGDGFFSECTEIFFKQTNHKFFLEKLIDLNEMFDKSINSNINFWKNDDNKIHVYYTKGQFESFVPDSNMNNKIYVFNKKTVITNPLVDKTGNNAYKYFSIMESLEGFLKWFKNKKMTINNIFLIKDNTYLNNLINYKFYTDEISYQLFNYNCDILKIKNDRAKNYFISFNFLITDICRKILDLKLEYKNEFGEHNIFYKPFKDDIFPIDITNEFKKSNSQKKIEKDDFEYFNEEYFVSFVEYFIISRLLNIKDINDQFINRDKILNFDNISILPFREENTYYHYDKKILKLRIFENENSNYKIFSKNYINYLPILTNDIFEKESEPQNLEFNYKLKNTNNENFD